MLLTMSPAAAPYSSSQGHTNSPQLRRSAQGCARPRSTSGGSSCCHLTTCAPVAYLHQINDMSRPHHSFTVCTLVSAC